LIDDEAPVARRKVGKPGAEGRLDHGEVSFLSGAKGGERAVHRPRPAVKRGNAGLAPMKHAPPLLRSIALRTR
jgi:hypothetical protein